MKVKKIINELQEIAKISSELKKTNSIVLCHGCFDILHIGHVRHFQAAKNRGDILIVSVTADRYINKGPARPVFSQELRMEFIAHLEIVDYVILSKSPSAIEIIKTIKPDIFAKGNDYRSRTKNTNPNIFIEEKVLNELGGKLIYTDEITSSSTDLLNLIQDRITSSHPVDLSEKLN